MIKDHEDHEPVAPAGDAPEAQTSPELEPQPEQDFKVTVRKLELPVRSRGVLAE